MKNSTGEAGAPSEKKKTYPYEEVLKEALKYFDGDELAATTWAKKYALKDLDGRLLEKTPADMHHRMAREFARIEKKYPAKDKARLSTYGQARSEMGEKEIFRVVRPFSLHRPAGERDDGSGQQGDHCLLVQLRGGAFGDRFLWGYLPHRRAIGPTVQTPLRSGGGYFRAASQKFRRIQCCWDDHRCGVLHGAFFQHYARGGSRTAAGEP